MEEKSEDLPKPPLPRRAARPFVSPTEGVTGPFQLKRRGAQLFTPPGSTPATPAADTASPTDTEASAPPAPSPAADGAEMAPGEAADLSASADPMLANAGQERVEGEIAPDIELEGNWPAPSMITPERTLNAESLMAAPVHADDDTFVVEQFEHEDIELTPASTEYADEHSIEVIAYDDANSLLQAAAPDGKHPKVDGLQLETTEFSFEQEPAPPRMNVESFWATDPFGATHDAQMPMDAASADLTEATIDADTAGEPLVDASANASASANAPAIDDQPVEWADDPSTMISHAQAALEPEPEHEPLETSAPAPTLADIAPPWMNRLTPVSNKALEELKEAEPWDLTPAYGIAAIPEAKREPESEVLAATASDAPVQAGVADALERIVARLRAGELEVHAEAEMSDEAALSAVLTALLRARR